MPAINLHLKKCHVGPGDPNTTSVTSGVPFHTFLDLGVCARVQACLCVYSSRGHPRPQVPCHLRRGTASLGSLVRSNSEMEMALAPGTGARCPARPPPPSPPHCPIPQPSLGSSRGPGHSASMGPVPGTPCLGYPSLLLMGGPACLSGLELPVCSSEVLSDHLISQRP